MWLNGHDLRGLRLVDRTHIDGYVVDFFRMICERNLEGIVAKHRASPYDASSKWIKIKNPTYTQAQRRHELFELFQIKRREAD